MDGYYTLDNGLMKPLIFLRFVTNAEGPTMAQDQRN